MIKNNLIILILFFCGGLVAQTGPAPGCTFPTKAAMDIFVPNFADGQCRTAYVDAAGADQGSYEWSIAANAWVKTLSGTDNHLGTTDQSLTGARSIDTNGNALTLQGSGKVSVDGSFKVTNIGSGLIQSDANGDFTSTIGANIFEIPQSDGAGNVSWTLPYGKLSGINWGVFGDSFSELLNPNYYAWHAQQKTGISPTVYAVSGHNIWQQVDVLNALLAGNANALDNFQIISLLAGVNDFTGNYPLGDINDAVGATTVHGKLKEFITVVLGANPNVELYIMTPPEANSVAAPYQGTNTAGWTLEILSQSISAVAGSYGVKVINLHKSSQFNLQTIGTYTTDNLHPNTVGAEVLGDIVVGAFINRETTGQSGGAGGADNLGNHFATQALNLNGNNLLAASNEQIFAQTGQFIQPLTTGGAIRTASVANTFINIDSDNNGTGHYFGIFKDSDNETGPILFAVRESGNVGIGLNSPTHALHVVGSPRIVDGNQGVGKILVSDALGVGSWSDVAAIGDNLGDHQMTQFLQTNGNWINNDGGANDGIFINTSGFVGIRKNNPAQAFDMIGNAIINGWQHINGPATTGQNTYIRFQNNGTQVGIIGSDGGISTGNAEDFTLQVSGNHDFYVKTNAVKRTIVTGAGNFGVGTLAPTERIHVDGSFRMEDGNEALGYLMEGDANGVATWTAPVWSNTGAELISTPTKNVKVNDGFNFQVTGDGTNAGLNGTAILRGGSDAVAGEERMAILESLNGDVLLNDNTTVNGTLTTNSLILPDGTTTAAAVDINNWNPTNWFTDVHHFINPSAPLNLNNAVALPDGTIRIITNIGNDTVTFPFAVATVNDFKVLPDYTPYLLIKGDSITIKYSASIGGGGWVKI